MSQKEENKQTPVRKVFAMPYLLHQIFQFIPPLDLILHFQFLSKTAWASLHSSNQFLRWSLRNALGQHQDSRLKTKEEEKRKLRAEEDDLLEAAKALMQVSKRPRPVQCLGFRSTLGNYS